ncbi:MAG: adenylate/guanylate cyclase domain-containing protein, partial [Flavobacteriales bacterium]
MKRRDLFLLVLLVLPAWSQVSAMQAQDTTSIRLDEHRLRSGAAFVRTALLSLPGVDLVLDARPHYCKRDDLAFAARAFDDGAWPVLGPASVEQLYTDSVHWIRFELDVAPTMAGVPVDLTICTQGAMQVFLNGVLIEHFGALPSPGSAGVERAPFVPRRTLRIHFIGDGHLESLAVRTVYTPIILPGMLSGSDPFTASLHLPEVTERMARVENSSTLQYGVYLGINLIILLLASVIYSRNRRDLSWLMLGLLALFQALVALSNIPPRAAFGLSLEAVTCISFSNMLVYVLGLFFLVLTMRAMFDRIHARSLVLFGAVSLAMIIASYVPYLIPRLFGRLDGWFTIFFFYEVARQAWRAVRKKVHGSWIIGIGALLFLLNGVFVEQFYNVFGLEMGRWMRIYMRFSYYLTMPLTIAIYLAERSAHHTKLLARQRDELDMEVQERTSELRKEKELSDELLLNILPHEVAEELKKKGVAEAVQIDQVTVLFTDFKGFTAMSEQVTPTQLVRDLHECFSA